MNKMNNRLQKVIKYKTGGRQVDFADFMGWSPQYLSKLIRGKDFGISPVISLLQRIPELNARWLLLGEGAMLQTDKVSEVRATAQSCVLKILELEKYLVVMTPYEVREFEQMCVGKAHTEFSEEQIQQWQERLDERNKIIDNKFNKAYANSR